MNGLIGPQSLFSHQSRHALQPALVCGAVIAQRPISVEDAFLNRLSIEQRSLTAAYRACPNGDFATGGHVVHYGITGLRRAEPINAAREEGSRDGTMLRELAAMKP
jgi:hypothetical protein